MAEKGSPPLWMSAVDWRAVAVQFLLALLSFVLTWVTENIGDWDFGGWTEAVMIAWRTFIELVKRFLPDTRKL